MHPVPTILLCAVAIACLGVIAAGADEPAGGEWQPVAAGVEYRHVVRDGLDAHAARADLDAECVQVIASAADDRGLTVSEFARRHAATVAVNGDYFDLELDPVGLAMGDGVVWAPASDMVRRQEVVAVAGRRVEIRPRTKPLREPEPWMAGAVSGWPMLVSQCRPVEQLPGSDHFTRAPHPRTAVGLSGDGRRMLMLVADGRREGVPGPTLPELAGLMVELGACTALNLDGGGSSALWVGDRIVNEPSDGLERRVGNHLAVVTAPGCGAGSLPGATSPRPDDAGRP
jgi:exopolysaccharide biosynthesis protein